MKFLQRDESRMQFTFYSLLVGTVLLLAAALWRTGSLDFPGPGTWLGLAYLAILSTAVTFWLLQLAAPVLGPNRVVAYTFLTPSLVLALQWLIGSKPIEPAVLPGIAITLVTVWLLQRVAGQHPTTIQTDL